ncbi:lycopene cyclase family protein [Flavobacterium crassostreae]|uniref:Lycopene cyclase n=1 Tax=Flavobacterium crassostreae TaxID=1763534 RepID=A0A1B9E0E3_9FLAO|nr:lycopene cyclase family protein [Flavobacterium crassostreae]OCB75399.1 lycopene cyclase [Flavobacterium crassostreae]
MKHYDYIFTGSGLAALMTVYKMIQSGAFEDKTILLMDPDSKKINDRTWCFWQDAPSDWERSVTKKWELALFATTKFRRDLELKPYTYNRINASDFYSQALDQISKQKNIHFLNEKVTDIHELKTHVYVATETQSFTGEKVFNSIYRKGEAESQTKYPILQQHFIGWFIKSKEAVFNPEQATFMDFSVAQKGNTRFMYVLPTATNEALVEYTLFSHQVLDKRDYETEIQNYLAKLGVTEYEITDKEKGSIPMSCYPFWKKNSQRVLHIGTAGGWTKASTGYTFKNADKKSTALIAFLQKESDLTTFHKRTKFWFYDLLLLDILDRDNQKGARIFSSMFQKGSPALIFKFLDEETSFYEDIRVILKCPKMPFIWSLIRSVRYLWP